MTRVVLGIDPGTTTGLAVWDLTDRQLLKVESFTILQAMQQVLIWRDVSELVLVIFEDARITRLGGGSTFGKKERLQGVGSIKRDCAIWEEFLTSHAIAFEAKKARTTKVEAKPFEQLTGWTGKTNNHARDAAMIVHGLNEPIVNAKLLALKDASARTHQAGPAHPRRRTGYSRRRRNSPN